MPAERESAIEELIRTARHSAGCSADIDPDAYRCRCGLAQTVADAQTELARLSRAERAVEQARTVIDNLLGCIRCDPRMDGSIAPMGLRGGPQTREAIESARAWLSENEARSAATTKEET